MQKKVLVISSSPRRGGNSDTLAERFVEGAREAGHEVEKISLAGKRIEFCKGCFACQRGGRCPIRDDAAEIVTKLPEADVLVFATPVYYYSVSGQLKTLLDRANPVYVMDYRFRSVYLLAAAAEDEENTVSGTQTAIQGWVDCFPKSELIGTVFAGGVTDPGQIAGHKALEQAYRLGLNI